VAGAWAWIAPSALAAITVRWQTELVFGRGYIYLAYEYVGVALVAAGGATLLARPSRGRVARVCLAVAFALALVGIALAISSNMAYAARFVPGPQLGIT
jgi:hypothetical protein